MKINKKTQLYCEVLLFLITIFFLCSFTNGEKKVVELNGTVNNIKNGTLYLQSFHNKIYRTIDSTIIKDYKFNLKTNIESPELYGLSVDTAKAPFMVFIDNSKLDIELDSSKHYINTRVEGSKGQVIFEEYKKKKNNLDIDSFIKMNKMSIVSAYILYRDYSYKLKPSELLAKASLLDESLNNTQYVTELKNICNALTLSGIGNKAPEFESSDPNGKLIKLSQIANNGYLLIDFWASWCPPCRKENPNVVEAYNKYHEKGFDIISVSLDKKKDSWIKAINDDNLKWFHVSELNYWESSIAKLYGIRAIPSNVLIDKDGIIIARNLKGEQLQQFLENILK